MLKYIYLFIYWNIFPIWFEYLLWWASERVGERTAKSEDEDNWKVSESNGLYYSSGEHISVLRT